MAIPKGEHFDWPLFDPEAIDPENEHIEELVTAIHQGDYEFGQVCGVYEMCGHLLCAKSYELWVAYDKTVRALRNWKLNGKEATQPHDHELISAKNEVISGGYYCRICGLLVDENVSKEFVVEN